MYSFTRVGEGVLVTQDGEAVRFYQTGIFNVVQHHAIPSRICITEGMASDESGYDLDIYAPDIEGYVSISQIIKDLGAMFARYAPGSTPSPALYSPENFAVFLRNAGNTNAIGNYSVTPTDFVFEASALGANATVELSAICMTLSDTAGGIDSGFYGDGITLANGVDLIAVLDGQEVSLLDSHPIKTNGQYASHGFCVALLDFGQGAEMLQAKANIAELLGSSIRLLASRGDKILVRLHDDFSGLLPHQFKVMGSYYSPQNP